MGESRTSKSIKNSFVSLSFYLVNLVVGFVSRKVFLDYLGAEILGLNTTAQNILEFLNLAELGVGSAIGYFLYKPLSEGDKQTVKEIIALQGHIYKRIAVVIIIGSITILPFFPFIFKKISLPLWYTYVSFGVFLFGSLLTYFINYKQVVLTANQQNYKIQYSYKSVMILRSLAQIYALYHFDHPFLWWCALYVVFSFIGSISLHIMTMKTAPYLNSVVLTFRALRSKYPNVSVKVKQLLFHRIGAFALGQSSTLIIYAYTSLALVAYYGNYMMIISGVTMLVNALFDSMDSGIGNLVAEGNKSKIMGVFNELFSVRFFLATVICFMVFYLTPDFISVWIGRQYLLPESTLALMCGILFIGILRFSVGGFINAYGLYSDIYAPIIEAILNIGLSILLGFFYGLNGILSGVLISLILVIACWKPYFLFWRGLKEKYIIYLKIFVHNALVGVLSWFLTIIVLNFIHPYAATSYVALILKGLLYFVGITVTFGGLLFLTEAGIKQTIKRFI